jgi:DNA-binding MarR family transcriptional regulator
MPPRPRPKADQQAPSVLARVAPLVSRWVERVLAEHDPPLTLAQYLAMEGLDSGQASATELAGSAGVSRSAVSQLLVSLEDIGLIERTHGGPDRRTQPLHLSPEGHGILRSSRRLLRARLDPLVAELPPHRADDLARSLRDVEKLMMGKAPPRRRQRPHPPPPRR